MKSKLLFTKFLLMFAFLFFGVAGVEFAKEQPQKVLAKIEASTANVLPSKTINLEKKFFTVTFVQEARADEATSTATSTATATETSPAPADEIPSWIAPIVVWLQSIPTVGPILVEVLKWLGIVAAVLTALSTFMMALSKAVVGIAGMAGFVAFAEKAQKFFDVVLKYAKYLSMFNVQKK